jgi:low affinity Fe/Cu permease
MNAVVEKEILTHLLKIEDQLIHLNSKIENFLGIEELSPEEMEELDMIESEMDKGNKFSFQDLV